jgi:hypothetical protein
MKIANLCLVLFLCLSFSNNSLAARFWVAAVSSNWNNIANWSAVSGGASGASVPGVGDDVNFDNGGLGSCSIDIPVSIRSITVAALYTGIISQATNSITTVNAASFSGGTFTGGTANITIGGAFTLSGTAFTSTSAILEIDNNTVAFTSGIFTHNNGSVRLNFAGVQTMTGTSPVFFTLEFVGAGSTYTISSAGNITVMNSLNLTGAQQLTINAGTLDLKGDINSTNTNTGDGGSAQININGAGAQNFNGNTVSGTGALPQLAINKTTGTLNLANFPAVANNFTFTAGTINAGTSTFCFTRGSVNAYNITGSLTLNNISFNLTNVVTATIAAATTLTATGDLTLAGAGNAILNTGIINVNGNINLTNTGNGGGGSATINIVGAGNQNVDGTAIIVNESRLPIIDVNKTGGTLSLLGNISASANVTYTAGTVNAGTSTCYVVNNLTVTGNMDLYNLTIQAAGGTTLTVASGSTVSVANTLDLENAANLININTGTIAVQGNIIDNNTNVGGGGNAVILINGTGNQSITTTGVINQGRFPGVTINKPFGILTLPALMTVRFDWTFVAGMIDAATNNSTVVFENTMNITGTHTLNNITFNGQGNYVYTIGAATTLTVPGTMTMMGASNVDINSGNINLSGNMVLTNTSIGDGGSTVITFLGAASQSITSALPINQSALPAVTINKTGGTLVFPALITVRGNWTYTGGTYDVTTNNSTIVFTGPLAGGIAMTGTHTLNNVTLEGNNNNVITVGTGTILTVTGTLTTMGANNVFINTPVTGATAIQAQGNININNTSLAGGGTGVILINGTAAQAFTSTVTAGLGQLPYITIQKATGTLTMFGVFSVTRDWNYISGVVDATTNLTTVDFGWDNLLITSAGMKFYHVIFNSSSITLTNSLTVAGNLTINGTGILAPVGNTINLAGNWTNRSTAGFTELTSTVNFNGSALQMITVPGGENFTNLIVNNTGAGIQLENNVQVTTNLTMTLGNINLNSNSLTLGLSSANNGTLSWTSGTIINTGSFIRWFKTVTIASGSASGLFPMGTAADYRPIFISAPVVAPTTGGTIAVVYTDATTNSVVSIVDAPFTVVIRKDLNWALSTAGLAGGLYNMQIQGTSYGLIGNVSDLRLTLAGSVVGIAGINGGTVTNPQVNRIGLTQSNLNNTFFLGSINATSSPLPITLISFTATPENGVIKLNWETSAEVNNDHFTIQRSTNSIQWQDIQIVAGSGNTNIDSKYSAYDLNPYTGISYYRLEQTDLDGKQSFSMIRQINLNTATTINIYPNPVTDHIYVTGIGNMQVVLYNNAGQLIRVPSELNGNGVILYITSLQAGIYFIHILQNGNAQTTNMIIKE